MKLGMLAAIPKRTQASTSNIATKSAAIQKRREECITTEHEENVRQQILDGLESGPERTRTQHRQESPTISKPALFVGQ
jgi:hypothetical protein